MKIKIAENIRKYRKERELTQEQLAETLGVTVGAVYKWEAGLSTPEIKLIMEIADFFEISVDVLLGYEQHCGNVEDRIEEIQQCIREKDFEEAVLIAEKSLKKYPNHFELVYISAVMYQLAFMEEKRDKAIERSNELFQHAISLLYQNTHAAISEVTIRNHIAENYLLVEKAEQALEILKQNNVGGINNSLIGMTYVRILKQPETAKPYLIKSFADSLGTIIRSMGSMAMLNAGIGMEAISWLCEFLDSMKIDREVITFIDKFKVVLMAQNAIWSASLGDYDKAKESVRNAYLLAEQFDATSVNHLEGIRFLGDVEGAIAYDDIGKTAVEAVHNLIYEEAGETKACRFVREVWEEMINEASK